MSGWLAGKVAVITGGASGLGRATALRFAEEGAHVVIGDLQDAAGEEAAGAARQLGVEARYLRTDVRREADCEALAEAAYAQFGRLDLLFSAAGVMPGTLPDGSPRPPAEERQVATRDLAGWDFVIGVNLTGTMLMDRAAGRRMVAAGHGGSIINVASIEAYEPHAGNADYCVSKAGVAMLTKVLALELATHAIRVNAIAPGAIDTPMFRAAGTDPARRQAIAERAALARVGEPRDIAAAALFLASDDAAYVTGAVLHVDGGRFSG